MTRQTGARLIRILLSGGFVLASAAYAVWQHAVAVAQPKHPLQSIAAAPKPQPVMLAKTEPAPELTLPKQSHRLSLTEGAAQEPKDTYVPPPPGAPPAQPIINFAAPDPPKPVRTAEAHDPYADGEFTGGVAETVYGDTQVKVVVRGGVLAQVVPLVYPDHRQRSEYISEWAIPILEQEAVTVQTANIDLISQATVTSQGYQESLASALVLAKKQ